MKNADELKQIVKEKYGKLARQENQAQPASCCGSVAGEEEVYNIMSDDYSALKGYVADADLGLGCGLPTQFARISPGDTVIDLGSGAGNDCFVARHETGEAGKVIGIDFSEDMIAKARRNAEKLGFRNVEFRQGDIEEMPVSDNLADVVISNCVLNLVPDKASVFGEIYRVLKPGGHFSISDIVLRGELPGALREDAEMYAGCVAGAIARDAYLQHIRDRGFEDITLQKEKAIELPASILEKYLNAAEIAEMRKGHTGIFSITVFGRKPGLNEEGEECCPPDSGCC